MLPDLRGIAVIREVSLKNSRLCLVIELAGLEDRPVEVELGNFSISGDGASVAVGEVRSNMPFVENALERFMPRTFSVPESARAAVLAAKAAFGI